MSSTDVGVGGLLLHSLVVSIAFGRSSKQRRNSFFKSKKLKQNRFSAIAYWTALYIFNSFAIHLYLTLNAMKRNLDYYKCVSAVSFQMRLLALLSAQGDFFTPVDEIRLQKLILPKTEIR